ncbi:MAG: hypothetical protein Q7U04_17705 [Bacteriovorax sp.]|nr:hypothetical protein [Bacteriovorax sp.]
MTDNNEIEQILEKLENLEDEVVAVELLSEFNRASSELGKLLLNLDTSLTHDEWKILCDKAQSRLNQIVKKIDQY